MISIFKLHIKSLLQDHKNIIVYHYTSTFSEYIYLQSELEQNCGCATFKLHVVAAWGGTNVKQVEPSWNVTFFSLTFACERKTTKTPKGTNDLRKNCAVEIKIASSTPPAIYVE